MLNPASTQYPNLAAVWVAPDADPGVDTLVDQKSGLVLSDCVFSDQGSEGWCLTFDGTNFSFNDANDPALSPPAMTLCIRVYFDVIVADTPYGMVTKRVPDQQYQAYAYGSLLAWHTFAAGGQIVSGSVVSASAWYDIVVTYGPTGFQIFLNKSSVASGSYGSPLSASTDPPFIVGSDALTGFLIGKIQTVRVYNAVLDQSVIDAFTDDPGDLFLDVNPAILQGARAVMGGR